MKTLRPYLGTCSVCFSEVASDSAGNLVRHGWKESGGRRAGRYGHAWHQGGCWGSKAFEKSKTQTEQAIAANKERITKLKADLQAGAEHPYQIERQIKDLATYIQFAQEQIESWHPQKLRDRETVEREKSETVRREREAAAQAREETRQEKQAQKRARETKKLGTNETINAVVLPAPVGTVWTLAELRRATGQTKAAIHNYIWSYQCNMKRDALLVEQRKRLSPDGTWHGWLDDTGRYFRAPSTREEAVAAGLPWPINKSFWFLD